MRNALRSLIPLLFLLPACDGGEPTPSEADADTDTDTDTDADTDTDTDADTDTTPEHCPQDGKGVLEVVIAAADPGFTSADELSIAVFPVNGGPPIFYFTVDGADLGTLPATVYANNATPGTYEMQTNCFDAGADTLNFCDGTDDVLVTSLDTVTIEAGMLHHWEVDFTAGTYTATTVSAPASDCLTD